MKTKEIDVWVNRSIVDVGDDTKFYDIYTCDKNNPWIIKAKLVIETPEPEKEITITEKEFDEIWDKRFGPIGCEGNHLKRELGFKK